MADVTIRHRITGEERTVAEAAVPFFPDHDIVQAPEATAKDGGRTAKKEGTTGGI